MSKVLAAAVLAAAAVLPAQAGLFDDDEARRRIELLRQELAQQGKDNEARIARLEESIRNIGVVELLQRLEMINAEIARLRGQIEVLAHENEQLQKRQRDFYLDIDSRLKRLEVAAAASPAPAPSGDPAASAAPGAAPDAPAGTPPKAPSREDQAREVKAYDTASNLFRRNDFAGAIGAFRTFVRENPASTLVPNAHYWIGISHANLRDFPKALAAQQEVVAKFPQSPKAPDAMLAIAAIQVEQGDTGSARDTLEDIIARFPASEAAGKARMRLATLRR